MSDQVTDGARPQATRPEDITAAVVASFDGAQTSG